MTVLKDIIVVGAGPAGLTLTLLLAKAGIRVRLLEQSARATDETRAVFYNAVSQYEFKRAGVYEDVMEHGFALRHAAFRDLTGKRLFTMPGAGQIALIQKDLTALITKRLEQEKDAQLLWSHSVVGLGQDTENAWVDVETPQGKQRLQAQYIVGCDGGSSIVRRELFGKDAMPGFTWDKQLVAADIRYDLKAALPDAEDSNIFMDGENAWLAFRPNKHDAQHWRIIYRDINGLSDDEYTARSAEKFTELLMGHPTPDKYEVIRIRAYKIHQRLVEKMRDGRFVLAGDAAHLCCPTGALGLNGAIADVGSLYDCLLAIHEGKADDSLLDIYNDVRRDKFKTIIDPQSQGILKTIFSKPEDIVPNHPMYKMSQLMEKDPETARKNAPNPLALRYDFSAHFKDGN